GLRGPRGADRNAQGLALRPAGHPAPAPQSAGQRAVDGTRRPGRQHLLDASSHAALVLDVLRDPRHRGGPLLRRRARLGGGGAGGLRLASSVLFGGSGLAPTGLRVLSGALPSRMRSAPRLAYATVPACMARPDDGVQVLGTSVPIWLPAPGLDFELVEDGDSQ